MTLDEDETREMRFSGELVKILGPFPFGIGFNLPILRQLRDMRADEFALLDANNDLVVPHLIPIINVVFEPVSSHLLTNGSETKALLIPAVSSHHIPLLDGIYRLDFQLDRARFRSSFPDDISNYRADATINISW